MTGSTTVLDGEDSLGSPTDHVEAVVRRSETSFFWAMRRLAKGKRQAMFALYAFCREVDDIVDNPGEKVAKRLALLEWRDEIERLFAGCPRTLTCQALLPAVSRYSLQKDDFRAVIDGMEMDARDYVRIADMDELKLYCDRVAGAVGRISTDIFGLPRPFSEVLANSEGLALQLTNIQRDLVEDSKLGRLYLPADVLAAHEITDTGDLARVLDHPRLPRVCEELTGIAIRNFEEAINIAHQCDADCVRPAMMMLQVYRRVLERLQHRGWKDLATPVSLSKPLKLWIAVRYGVL